MAAALETLADYVETRADLRIECRCHRLINMPWSQISARFGGLDPVTSAATRLKCRGCGRRGHATISPVIPLSR